MGTLRVVLGDQLNFELSSLADAVAGRDDILMAEVRQEATYAAHHKKKIALIFSAMRHFAQELREQGFTVHYTQLTDLENTHSLFTEIKRQAERKAYDQIILTEPAEYRFLATAKTEPSLTLRPDTRFLCTHEEFQSWALGRKQLRMEYFYREMRRKTGFLMQGDKPEGSKWNFDQENRKPAENNLFMPRPSQFKPDEITQDVLDMVTIEFSDNFGDLTPFWFACTRDQALQALDYFVKEALADFGAYQDAMLKDEAFLYHSVLSPYINIGLLNPYEVCERVEEAYRNDQIPLNSAEGFIRQIIGWREYVRGIYWLKMPGYDQENFFDAQRKLPKFYWDGDTNMRCMQQSFSQTIKHAYAHHIQRLMVTGNFALICGINPHELHEWYLGVYADAFEWVELPNTLGMSQFGDGGLLASKPYASSGNYIDKMSDYCANCTYKVKEKTGRESCPFNSLYWDFLTRNRSHLETNPRISMVYRTWDKMKEDKKNDYLNTATYFLSKLDKGERV